MKLEIRLFKWFLFIFLASYFALLYFLPPIRFYNIFYLQTFDYGILFQSSELLSRFLEPLITVRGTHAWADNQDYFQLAFAPLHWLGNSHYYLLIFHSLAIYAVGLLGAAMLWSRGFSGIFLAVLAWASPLMLTMNLDLFHTEAFATFWLLLMFLGAWKGRTRLFYFSLLLAIFCKEDVAITAGWFCVLAAISHSHFKLSRVGLLFGAMSCAVLFFTNFFIIQPFYELETCRWLNPEFDISQLSETTGPKNPWFKHLFENPFDAELYTKAFLNQETGLYFLKVFWPLLVYVKRLPLLVLLPLPAVLVNCLGGGYLIQGQWHYDHSSFAMVLAVLILGLSKSRFADIISLALGISMCLINLVSQPLTRTQLFEPFESKFWMLEKDARVEFVEKLNQVIPKDLLISADYTSVNYLMPGREEIYNFHNPFYRDSFGVYGVCEEFAKKPEIDFVLVHSEYEIREDILALLERDFTEYRFNLADKDYYFRMWLRPESANYDKTVSILKDSFQVEAISLEEAEKTLSTESD